MLSRLFLIARLLTVSALVIALPSCANKASLPVFPPFADLTPSQEPTLPVVDEPTAEVLDAYDIAHEAWGRTEHEKLVRLCNWYKDMGAKQLICERAKE